MNPDPDANSRDDLFGTIKVAGLGIAFLVSVFAVAYSLKWLLGY